MDTNEVEEERADVFADEAVTDEEHERPTRKESFSFAGSGSEATENAATEEEVDACLEIETELMKREGTTDEYMETEELHLKVLDEDEAMFLSRSKCLLCLEPAEDNSLAESIDLVLSFVSLTAKGASRAFSRLPKKLFTNALMGGLYCNRCYNQLHELNFLHNKIRTLQENLSKLGSELETQILNTYYRLGDEGSERDSREVAELRRRLYKLSLKLFPVVNKPPATDSETEVIGEKITVTITPDINSLSDEGGEEKGLEDDDELWEPDPEDLRVAGGVRKKYATSRRRRRRNRTLPAKFREAQVQKSPLIVRSKTEEDSAGSVQDSDSAPKSTEPLVKPRRPKSVLPRQVRPKKLSSKTSNIKSSRKKRGSPEEPDTGIDEEQDQEESGSDEDGTSYTPERAKPTGPKRKRNRATGASTTSGRKGDFKCTVEDCDLQFTTEALLFVHIKKVHEGLSKPHACPECGKCYRTPSKLTVHKRSHTGETPYTCEFCGKSFRASWYLKQHVRMHNGPLQCDICGKRAVSRLNLEAHMNTHSNVKPYVCEFCGEGFATKQYLQFHQANKHQGTTDRDPVKCPECGKVVSSTTALRNHRMSAHKIGEPKYKCDVCGSNWNNKRELRCHYTVVHLNERKYSCDICQKKCSTAANVRVHKERHHFAKEDRPRPFKCPVCHRAFFIKKTLENHMAIHSSERPYACGQCEKRFPSMSYLNLHVYTIHDQRKRKTPAPPRDPALPQSVVPKSKPRAKPRPRPQLIPIEALEVEAVNLVQNEVSSQFAATYSSYYVPFHQYPDPAVTYHLE